MFNFSFLNVPKVSIYRAKDMGFRDWGQELLLGLMPAKICDHGVSMKLIQMNAGNCGRFQMHYKRDEYGYLLEGAMRLRVGLSNGKIDEFLLEPGDAYHFPAGLPHQEEAIVFTRILEMSPAVGNDRLGLEEEYGLPRPKNSALKSSTPEEIFDLKQWWKSGYNYKRR